MHISRLEKINHKKKLMKINQIYTDNELRNFTYILELDDLQAIVIDPWDADVINQHLENKNLALKAIINTHEHWDHTKGNETLIGRHQCEVWAHENGRGKIPGLSRTLKTNESIELGLNSQLSVLDTPGHTFAHLCFLVTENGKATAVFTGDTLFNAGVGHCRSGGNEEILYQTISEHFQNMDANILVYPGHDYLENNLKFTLHLEPNNQIAKQWLARVLAPNYSPGSIQTKIGDERNFNTFLRLDNEDIINHLSLEQPSAKQVFIALRGLRDKW
jgi:hydroxyacylglutathione hydrolase